ncbi:MAG TPA: glutamate 5-kinase [Geminicoccaceae bacterium]|jgi:glutamate 5-kinase|nr:glutamate 5-kinase [Geminicoccaceae bacterium]
MSARRLVIKIGSSLLVDGAGRLRREWLDSFAADLATCRENGQEGIVVTSGAIALGRAALGLKARVLRLEDKQAAAAVGQINLAHAYQASLAQHGLPTAQLLLTLGDTESRRHYLNARSTIEALLKLGVVPVVNENDTVATNEIRFGDNDRLSARVAVMASADELILLSDVDGLYTADPGLHESAVRLDVVSEITPEIEAMAGGAGSLAGTGGMVSKLAAARIATHAGCAVIIAPGVEARPLARLAAGGSCTRFIARANPRRARKEWIAGALAAMGVLRIDGGAARALRRGSSLLPAGVVAVEGAFERGDAVIVRDPDDRDLAKGLSAYDADDARRICGHRTEEIERLLGYRGRDELIHRDDLVLL